MGKEALLYSSYELLQVLRQLEEQTGLRVVDIFDWIVGTSVGGIIALGLVYGKKEF